MSHTLDVEQPLLADELEQVKAFADFLIARRAKVAAAPARPSPISFEGWAGCLAHVHPELSDKEFMRLIEDERVKEAME